MKKIIALLLVLVFGVSLVGCVVPPEPKDPTNLNVLFTDYGFESVYIDENNKTLITDIKEQSFYEDLSQLKLEKRESLTGELDEYYRMYLYSDATHNYWYMSFCGQDEKIAYATVWFNDISYGVETNIELFEKLIEYIKGDYIINNEEDFFSYLASHKDNIYSSLYNISGNKYGRIISSSYSKENAIAVCTRHFTNNRYQEYINTVVDCSIIYENEILYGLNVKWQYQTTIYEENVISFKKDVALITVRNVVYNDEESFNVVTNNFEQIKTICLYLFYNQYFLNDILKVETFGEDEEYIIDIYSYYVVRGDWDMKDEYNIVKSTIHVSKISGQILFDEEKIIKTYFK